MTQELIIKIVLIVLYVIAGAAIEYFKTNAKLNAKVDGLIDEAEEVYKDATKAGGTKFNYVVDKLYSYVPAVMKPFITRDMISEMVQGTFDAIQAYGKKQADKLVDKVID